MLSRIAAVLAAMLLVVACSTQAPITDITNAPLSDGYTQEQVGNAIERAAQSYGWVTRSNGPGSMAVTILVRTHQAEVDVSYTASDYSIRYLRSTNLDADGDRIHKNYNSWVANLAERIRLELAAMPPAGS